MQTGYVKELKIQRNKGIPFENVEFVELIDKQGIVGDCHAIGGEKQIALVSSEIKQWVQEQEKEGLCLSKFQANIETEGIDYSLLNQGDILKTNDVVIQITLYSKHCYENCRLIQERQPCKLRQGTVFAKVLQSGKLNIGDEIKVCNIL